MTTPTTPYDVAIAQLKTQIDAVEATASPLRKHLRNQEAARKQHLSAQFIAVSRITRDAVWWSTPHADRGNAPYFGMLEQFRLWVKTQNERHTFLTWNGDIHYTDTVLAGRFEPIEAVCWDDVPEGKVK